MVCGGLLRDYFRVAAAVNALLVVGLVIYTVYGYASLPEVVAVSFGPGGEPRIGHKTYLITPLAFMVGSAVAVAALITVFTLKRYVLIERYPYLVSLPALALILGKLPNDTARSYIDRLFTPLPLVAAALQAIMAFVDTVIVESARVGRLTLPEILQMVVIAALSFAIVAGLTFYYRKVFIELRRQGG